ncbi:hypothetical protein [Halalkalicoccus subterraneus]|uniref:hypothetical protein n=1 Tax=Halalkalicoccus subterraneus TaxID=2675002 RepID=UPI000EFBE347|nr:hypothetical protein [Halalkalicoccus subterraneus]
MVDGRALRRRELLRAGALCATVASAGCPSLRSGSDSVGEDEEPETYTLTVRIEENGQPALEASVSVQTAQLVPRADARVPGPDGIVSFELEDGSYIVRVESQEFTNVEEPVDIDGEDVEVTIPLERGIG